MDDISLSPRSALGGVALDIGGTTLTERSDLALVSIATPLGGEDGLADKLRAEWSLDLPEATRTSEAGSTVAIRTAPDQIFLLFPHDGPDAERLVRSRLDGAGYTTDQTDGWVMLDLKGILARPALERLSMIDLHDDAFPVGASARTVMEHLGTLVLRRADDTYLLMSARSSARSFLHAIEVSIRNVAA